MKFFLIVFSLLTSCSYFSAKGNAVPYNSRMIRVAVLDTGLNTKYSFKAKLCSEGHKDFTGEGLNDTHGHGTNVTGLIVKNAETDNFCIIVIKYFLAKDTIENWVRFEEALQYLNKIKVDVVNISGGGDGAVYQEKVLIEKLLNKGVVIVSSAGNWHKNLDEECNFYPSCYDSRIVVVGDDTRYSNYGSVVDYKVPGKNQTAFGYTLSGTSQSTAIYTGKLLKTIANNQKGL